MEPAGKVIFACDREALTAQQRKRHFETLIPKLRSLQISVHELPDGYEFELPADPATVALINEWIEGESRCCPFFNINLRHDREGGAVRLRLTGPEGAKRFIRSELFQMFEPE